MDELTRQVQRARRQLNRQQFLGSLVWTLFGALMVSVLGLALRKLWFIPVDNRAWLAGWIGGGIVVGLAIATVWTYVRRYRNLDAAIEIDRRFGLKERVSSSLSLHAEEVETPAGRALLQDAVRRVERIEVAEKFRFQPSWWNLLPLLPALLVFILAVFVPDAQSQSGSSANASQQIGRKPVKKSAETLKQKVADRKKAATEAGLEEAGELFEKLEKGVENLAKKEEVDRKQALVTLSDLAEELKQRREAMGGNDELKDQLSKLNAMKSGPADEMARAMKQGDFTKGLDELNELRKKLENNSLTAEEKQALAEQMEQMAQKMGQMAQAHEQAKRDLEKEINRLKEAGDLAKADQMQQQLDQMNMQSKQMERMAQMAQQLQQGAKKMKEGKPAEAGESLEQLAESMEEMAQELDEMEMLDDALEEIADAKNSMGCKKCMGAGCEFCQGAGMMGRKGEQPGQGMGEGQGRGDRPETETDKKFYDSRVRAEIKRGARGVVVGGATGNNVSGNVLEEVKAVLESASADESDPLTGQRLPKSERTQAQQYFDSLREGSE